MQPKQTEMAPDTFLAMGEGKVPTVTPQGDRRLSVDSGQGGDEYPTLGKGHHDMRQSCDLSVSQGTF